jgi:Flp pilus assembly protein TadD
METLVSNLIASARAATESKDSTAAALWTTLVEERPDDIAVVKEAASSLMGLKAFAAAEAILAPAIERFPAEPELLMDYGRCAGQQDRVEDEIARWALLRARFPEHVPGYINGIRSARRIGRYMEAEAIAAEGLARCGDHPALLTEQAIVADVRSDWPEAIRRWRRVEQAGQLSGRYYYGLGVALIRDQQIDEGEAVLWKGLAKHPKDLDLRVALAEAATARERWGEAVSIWRALLDEHPRNQRLIDGLGVATWRYKVQAEAGGEMHAGEEVHVADVGLVLDDAMREFMLRFESMGEDCEFGLVQRHYGAEPLSMLRWCSTHPGTVVAGLRREFEGVGEVANVEVDMGKPEIMVNEKSSGIRFHTFIQRSPSLDVESFAKRQAKHLAYLKRMFMERLRDGEKVYVYKVIKPVPLETLETIYNEIRKYSNSPLLIMQRHDAENPPGSFRRAQGDLFFGYVERFGLDNGPVWKINFDVWVSICKGVMRELGRPVP